MPPMWSNADFFLSSWKLMVEYTAERCSPLIDETVFKLSQPPKTATRFLTYILYQNDRKGLIHSVSYDWASPSHWLCFECRHWCNGCLNRNYDSRVERIRCNIQRSCTVFSQVHSYCNLTDKKEEKNTFTFILLHMHTHNYIMGFASLK